MHKEPRQVKPVQGDSFQPCSVPADRRQLLALHVLLSWWEHGGCKRHLPVLSRLPWSLSFAARNGSGDFYHKTIQKMQTLFPSVAMRMHDVTRRSSKSPFTDMDTHRNAHTCACPKPGENKILNSQLWTFTPTDTETILCSFSDLLWTWVKKPININHTHKCVMYTECLKVIAKGFVE